MTPTSLVTLVCNRLHPSFTYAHLTNSFNKKRSSCVCSFLDLSFYVLCTKLLFSLYRREIINTLF